MQLRRSLALGAAATLSVLSFASCGFDYATDREYTPGVGVNDRDGDLDVLAAVIVSAQPNSGRVVASLSNNLTDEEISLTEIASDASQTLTSESIEPVVVPPGQLVNLAETDPPLNVTGEFEAGDYVPVVFKFSNGETTTLKVPVVNNSGYYENLDGETTEAPSESPSETAESDSH